ARLRELERGLPSWARRSAPIAGLAQRVTSALAATGIDPATLGSLAPEARAAGRAGSAEFVRHQATLNLTGVTLPQVGLFLAAWREREPDWTVVSIDLRPLPTAAAPPGGDLPLQAVLRLESISLEARSPP
ncbi:MAG TPA: hypothetical protein VD963_03665, partial [Phycisphaerales bacterium]|nr:hypothetical protein [Phycisphaerales bacterium]